MTIGFVALILVAIVGSAVGSFLNVVIYRVPAGLSIVRPASRCPSCETPIRPGHNIPILGWLLVRGRCASCEIPISPRYPLIELSMLLLTVALFHMFAGGLLTAEQVMSGEFMHQVMIPFLCYLPFVAALVVITFIDLDWFIIPDVISLPGIPLGVLTAWAAGEAIGIDWQAALIGAGVGAGILIAVILVYTWLTGREGMGGGDWKLLGFIGAWLGAEALPVVLLLGSLQGILLALVLQRRFAVEELPPEPGEGEALPITTEPSGSEDGPKSFGQLAIPFGPFLALAALEYLLFRVEIRELLDAVISAS